MQKKKKEMMNIKFGLLGREGMKGEEHTGNYSGFLFF